MNANRIIIIGILRKSTQAVMEKAYGPEILIFGAITDLLLRLQNGIMGSDEELLKNSPFV